jgi:hypothetical protein
MILSRDSQPSGNGTKIPHAIIRGKNGRRHEVGFGDSPVRVEVYARDETVEIFVEAVSRRTRKSAAALPLSISRATFLAKRPAERHVARPRRIADVGTYQPHDLGCLLLAFCFRCSLYQLLRRKITLLGCVRHRRHHPIHGQRIRLFG